MFNLKTSSKHSEVFKLFSHIITGDEVSAAKPSPEIYKVASEKFNSHDPRCLVFEDAPNGVTAGIEAGMQVVMVPSDKVTKQYLLPATQVIQ